MAILETQQQIHSVPICIFIIIIIDFPGTLAQKVSISFCSPDRFIEPDLN